MCASRCSSSRRWEARSTFSVSEVDSAWVWARVEGWAVLGAWVSPVVREGVERISARSGPLYR